MTIVVLPSAQARALSSNAGVLFGLCSGWQLKSYGCQNLYENVARAIASGPYFSYLGGTQFLDLLAKAYFINCFLTLVYFFTFAMRKHLLQELNNNVVILRLITRSISVIYSIH